ncbi:MAG TPA: cupin domain-containing protein [Clostridia bacterium]|nr:cupin domain-containing protein [Clostridia bacterium]
MEIKNVNDSIVFNDNTFTKRVLFATDDVLSFVLNMKRGHVLPVHKHENTSLVMIVLSGSGEIQINNEVERLTKGSVVYAKGEDDFSIPSVSEDMTIYVTISPNPTNRLYSKEIG